VGLEFRPPITSSPISLLLLIVYSVAQLYSVKVELLHNIDYLPIAIPSSHTCTKPLVGRSFVNSSLKPNYKVRQHYSQLFYILFLGEMLEFLFHHPKLGWFYVLF
jgi:hypothetical protein